MAKYLLVHPIGHEFDAEAAAPAFKAIKASLTRDAYWINSWYSSELGIAYCMWDAVDKESILEAFKKGSKISGIELPMEGPYKLDVMFDAEDFR